MIIYVFFSKNVHHCWLGKFSFCLINLDDRNISESDGFLKFTTLPGMKASSISAELSNNPLSYILFYSHRSMILPPPLKLAALAGFGSKPFWVTFIFCHQRIYITLHIGNGFFGAGFVVYSWIDTTNSFP